jgi:hypothetical protein
MSPRRTSLRLLAAVGAVAALGGCSGYFDHNDTVSASAGDAVDANIAIQTIDPWPYASSKTRILSNGLPAASAGSTAGAAATAAAPVAAATPPVTVSGAAGE